MRLTAAEIRARRRARVVEFLQVAAGEIIMMLATVAALFLVTGTAPAFMR